ncbi:MAG: hypothetical protein ACMXX9_03150 [Candidatus Woesearchaeota archaeon]
MKRGQVTVFVLIVIVLIVMVGVGIYMYNQSQLDGSLTQEFLEDRNPEMMEIRSQIEFCLDELTKEALTILGRQGGYIELPDDLTYNALNPYDNNALRFIDGVIIPYSYHVTSSPDCTVCMFENNFPLLEIGPNSIRAQVERFVDENIEPCSNLDQFSQDYLITTGIPRTTVFFDDLDVKTNLEWEISAQDYVSDLILTERFYSSITDINFRDIYEVATTILYQTLINERTMEDYTLTIMRQLGYGDIIPPLNYRVVSSSTPTIYNLRDGFNTLRSELSQNINMLQVIGTKNFQVPFGLPEPLQNLYEYFRILLFADQDVLNELNINFMYLESWPSYINVNPNNGEIALPRSNPESMLGLIRIPRMEYDFRYDVSLPYLIEIINDKGFGDNNPYMFRFVYEANIKDSGPYQDVYSDTVVGVALSDSDQLNTNITVITVDGYTGEPITGVSVSYNCVDQSIALGLTDMVGARSQVTRQVPECISPTVDVIDVNYYSDEVLVEDQIVTLTVYPLKELDLSLEKKIIKPRVISGEYSQFDFEWFLTSDTRTDFTRGENVSVLLNLLKDGEPTHIIEFLQFESGVTSQPVRLAPGDYNVVVTSITNLTEFFDGEKDYIQLENETIKIEVDTPWYVSAISAVGGLFRKKPDVEDEFEIEGIRMNDSIITGSFTLVNDTLSITSGDLNNNRVILPFVFYDIEDLVYTRQLTVFVDMQDIIDENISEFRFRFE